MINLERIHKSRSLQTLIAGLLDRIDRSGSVPKSFSVRLADCSDVDSVRAFFGFDHVRVVEGKSVRLDVGALLNRLPGIVDELYAAMKRQRRDIRSERNHKITDLTGIIGKAVEKTVAADEKALLRWLERQHELCSKGRGELFQLFEQQGGSAVHDLLCCLQRGFQVLRQSNEPLRLSHFGLAVSGDTKSCRPGTPLLRKFIEILAEYDTAISEELENLGALATDARHRAVLDMTRLQADGAATQVLAFGQIVFSKGGKMLRYVADHAGLGEPVVLSWAQLDGAVIESVPREILTVENETSFYDLIECCNPSETAVFCTMGQANRLLVRLLRDISGRADSFRHCGDLDRSGVLILDSLRRRTGIEIKPFTMEPAILLDNLNLAQLLSDEEIQLTNSLLERRPQIVCADLLREILHQKRWLEQETITAACAQSISGRR